MRVRSYSELIKLRTFQERFDYLRLRGTVGRSTFGYDRWLNQRFYTSREWKLVRDEVIARDEALDLAMPDYEIYSDIVVHHMNPMVVAEVRDGDASILDPEYLITTTHQTHNAIHYGDGDLLPRLVVERRPGDTALWHR